MMAERCMIQLRGRRKIKIRVFDIVNLLLMLVLVLTFLLPFWMILTASLSKNSQLQIYGTSLWFRGLSIEGFRFLFQSSEVFLNSLWITFVTSLAAAVLEMVVCMLAAYALSKETLVGRKFFNALLMLTMFFSGGVIPTYLVVRGIGLTDTIFALILPGLGAAYHILLIRSYYASIPKSLEEAAYLDGAGEAKTFFKVYLPLSTAIVITVGMMQFVARWNNWMDSLLYIGPMSQKLWTSQYVLRQILANAAFLSSGGSSAPLIAARNAGIVIVILPLIIASPILQKFFISGMTVGAVKG